MAPKTSKVYSVQNFSKGLVTIRPPSLLNPGEGAVADNIDIEEGIIKRRPGWEQIHTVDLPSGNTEPVRSLFSYFQSGQGTTLLATAGTSLLTSTGGNFTEETAALAIEAPIRANFLAVNDVVYIGMVTGEGTRTSRALKKWSIGGGVQDVTMPSQSGWFLNYFNGSLFLAGDTSNPSRLYFSQQASGGGIDSWLADNNIDIKAGDGDHITGMGQLLTTLVVFKERSIHRVRGAAPDDASVESGTISVFSYDDQVGCIAPRSIASSQNLIVYLGEDGIYGYDGVEARELSENIRPLFNDLDEDRMRDSVGIWLSPNHYLLSTYSRGSTVPDIIISMKLRPERAFTIWRDLEAHSLEIYPIDGVLHPILGTVGKVGAMGESDTDNGERIFWRYATGVLPLRPKNLEKIILRSWLWAKPSGVLTEVRFLPNSATTGIALPVQVSAGFTQGETAISTRLPAVGAARQWGIEFAGEGNTPVPEIHELVIEYFTRFRG